MNIRKNNQGFTLIELLIVVVIIGILAAIAIPRFSATKGKAFDASAKTDLRNAMTAQEAYFSDFQTYTAPANLDRQASTGVTVAGAGSGGGYAMSAVHSSGGSTWCVTSAAGNIQKC
ncbi:MAG TPA: type II secretion system protein [Gemmatimonadota bacterium]|nr:type II secretion system protein [Gemmatimonadota bacterium]